MTRTLRDALPRANRLFDTSCALLLLLVVFWAANVARMPNGVDDFFSARITVRNVLLLALFLFIWNVAFALSGLHRSPSRQSLWHQALLTARACTIGSVSLLLFPLFSGEDGFRISMVASFWVMAMIVEISGRSFITLVARYLSSRAKGTKNLIIVGSGPRTLRLFETIQSQRLQYQVLGFVDTLGAHDISPIVRERLLGSLDDLERLLAQNPVDQVLVSLPVKSCYTAIQDAIHTCERVGVEVHYLSDVFSVSLAKTKFDEVDEFPAMRLTLVTEDYRLVIKRAFDITAAGCGLLVLAPIMGVCALLVKMSGPGPVFFKQQRFGFNRRQFPMYKFRTMVADAEALQAGLEAQNEASGPVFKIRRDPRITRVGRFLRKTSLDELPQLFNVLRGDMSIVGPRPLPVRDVSKFGEARLLRRFSVRPGITCLWQVTGRSDTSFDQWVQLDLAYIDNWSLSLDARILLKTLPAVISGSGAA